MNNPNSNDVLPSGENEKEDISMPGAWKIASRWGYNGPSVLRLFFDYGCAFYYDEGEKYKEAKKSDLLLVCDGETPVAIAKMQTEFERYREDGGFIHFCEADRELFFPDDNVCICRARFVMLDSKLQDQSLWGNETRRRFCRYTQPEKIKEIWDRFQASEEKGEFSISSRVCSLCNPEKDELSYEVKPLLTRHNFYRIPIYQRPYSWGENEIRRVMEDLHNAYMNGKEPVFMGTMQFSDAVLLSPKETQPESRSYEVIDGQQRLTTFIIILRILEQMLNIDPDRSTISKSTLVTRVNQGSAQSDLDEYWEWDDTKTFGLDDAQKNPYIKNALLIKELLKEVFFSRESDEQPGVDAQEEEVVKPAELELYDYLKTKLRFVVIETRAGLSKTLKIFNSINTTGLDLGISDVFKLRLYEHRKNKGASESEFDEISELYKTVDECEKKDRRWNPGMEDVLRAYQRVLIAEYGMKNAVTLFNFSVSKFYDELFDTLLDNQQWKDFEDYKSISLELSDIRRLIECFEEFAQEYDHNPTLKIYDDFIAETRYGWVWDYTVIARFFGSIEPNQILDFHRELFKLLVPPSLAYAKTVYPVRNKLVNLLKELKNERGIEVLNALKKNSGITGAAEYEFRGRGCTENSLFDKPKWKNLACRLVEWIQSGRKPSEELEELLFRTEIDIEHIQCYTDEKEPEKIWKEWGDEINQLGNLVILERSSNRSQKNKKETKEGNYRKSQFVSAQALADKVNGWKQEDAKQRRQEWTEKIWAFLNGDD